MTAINYFRVGEFPA